MSHVGRRSPLVPRGTLVVAAITLAVILPTPVSATAASTYSFSAATSSFVEVRLARPTVLDTARTRVSGGASFAGYYLQPLDAPAHKGRGELWIREFGHSPFPQLAIPLGDEAGIESYRPTAMYPAGTRWHLAAGRYRLHVLTDRQATVSLVFRGGGPRAAARIVRPSRFRAVVSNAAVSAAGVGSPAVTAADLPMIVDSANSLTFLATYYAFESIDKVYAVSTSQCLGPEDVGARCQVGGPAADAPFWGYSFEYRDHRTANPVPRLTGAALSVAYYDRGTAPAGPRRASFYVASGAVSEKIVVGAFSLAY